MGGISLPEILSGEGGGGKKTLVPSLDETPDILDEYVIPWLRKWNVGAGLMEEQGAESLHTRLHSFQRNFSGISNEMMAIPVRHTWSLLKNRSIV